MYRSAAGCLDSLAVIAPKIESIGCVFNAHRDADAWSCLHHSVRSNASAAIITYVPKTASLQLQKASLTYIETSSYSLVKENAQRKKSGSQHNSAARQERRQRSACRRRAGDDGRDCYESQRQKVRRLYNDQILAGFAGATGDAFALLTRFESKLEQYHGKSRARID